MWLTLLISAVQIGPDLQARLATAGDDEVLHVYTVMAKQPNHDFARGLATVKARADYYRRVAAEAREALIADIESGKIQVEKYYASWTNNSVELWIKKSEIKKLLDRNDIVMVELVPRFELLRPRPSDATNPSPSPNYTIWNINRVGADTIWVRYGLHGNGILLATMDSGIDTTHPALQGKVIKMMDFTSDGNAASDGIGHGTHTAGTIAGGTGYMDSTIDIYDIGVAPGVQLVHAKIFDNSGYPGNISGAFDWIASLKADSGYDIRAVGNSWGSANTTSTYYWNAVLTWKNLGIFPVFSIGNEGPGAGTAGTPGNYPTAIGVGATNSVEGIADFSSRGPAPNQSPWNDPTYWYIPDWNLIKPDISAPGVYVRSSIPGGDYAAYDGTSMASPHVTGGVALLLEVNPSLTPEQLYRKLIYTAYQRQDLTYPNNDFGWGRLDLLKAVQSLMGPVLSKGGVTADYGENWDPGETMTFDVELVNTGDYIASNIQGSIFTSSSYVTIVDGDAVWPDLAAGTSSYSNDGGFTVQADAGAPDGTEVAFGLAITYQDSLGNAFADTFYVSFVIGLQAYEVYDVDAGNIIVTISNNTSFPSSGYTGSAPAAGSGFVVNGSDQLYYGGFALAKSPTVVSDMWYGVSGTDADFANTEGIYLLAPPSYADFMAYARVTDGDVNVQQDALVLPNVPNAVVVRYWLTNTTSSDLTNLYAGLFLDLDIGGASYYNQNTGDVDAARNLAYLTYGGVYAGALYVGSNNGTALGNLTFLDNPTYVYNGTPDTIKYKFLSGELTGTAASANDYSVVVSAGPFNLSANAADTVALTFALVGGTSLTDLQDAADSLIANLPVSTKEVSSISGFSFAPVYSGGKLVIRFNLPTATNLDVNLFDVAGRKVATLHQGRMEAGNYTMSVTGNLSKGVYILKVDTDFGTYRKAVLIY